MFRKFLLALGLGAAASVASAQPYAPYSETAANDIYNLLFCDAEAPWRPGPGQLPTARQAQLFAEPPDIASLRALAADVALEGRIRMLAYNRLRTSGEVVPRRVLLGVIVEVGLADGLDTLAAFSDGGVRYVNRSGKMAIVEDRRPEITEIVPKLLAASQAVVDRLGPSLRDRRPPPKRGNVRLTFLVSDGLYSGEGPMLAMQTEPLTAPVVSQATELLLAVIKLGTR